jgi:hypothetical protein
MGEVYGADDLKLGQPVALKFLPESLERDPVRLAQLHSEVRLSRQISHPNVCRIYDIGEADGRTFLTMEYVDGEDLAALLRRIGRLPEDKALDIARQLCGGLAAAHERGVLHRDLKPANVMIDGEGQVRLADFGLAAIVGEVEDVRVGTPAYMAPEQLAGRDATTQSDIYALGLVLYETFTGRRAFTARTVADLVRQHEESDLTPLSAVVKDLDPVIERAVLRCLESEPARRPRTALAVAASLPGGDPLAAALAAGETPSPEMVAAAGERQAVRTLHTVVGVGLVLALMAGGAVWSATRQLTTRTPLERSPAVLVDRAQQALAALGYPERPAGTSWGFVADGDYLRYVREHSELFRAGDPYGARLGALSFYYRTSPRQLVPQNPLGAVTMSDPPLVVSGMTLIVLDTDGRLTAFHRIPSQRQEAAAPAGEPDWPTLFRLAGLDVAAFEERDPEWLPRGHADRRAAWEGALPDRPDVRVRVEAAAWQGRPTYFQIVGPWTRPAQMQEAPVSRGARLFSVFGVLATVGLLAGAVFMARSNVRAGRGDRQAAARLATVAVVAQLLTWLLNDPHPVNAQVQLNRFFTSIGEALFAGGVLYVMYLALEPAMRRTWPHSVLGSTRLLQGHFLDPLVGRDVLIGAGGGALIMLLFAARWPLQAFFGYDHSQVDVGNLRYLEGPRYTVGLLSSVVAFQAAFNAMWCVVAIVVLKRVLKRMWLAAIAATIFLTLVGASGVYVDQPGLLSINLGTAVIGIALLVGIVVRFGLLATVVLFLTIYVMSSTPWSLDLSRWDFPATALAGIVLAALAVYGGWAARSQPKG